MKKYFYLMIFAILSGCSSNEVQMNKADHVKSMTGDGVILIAWWDNPESSSIHIQDFIMNGKSYIPVFTSTDKAKEQLKGTPYTNKLVEFKVEFLADLMTGNETIIVNPADNEDLRFTGKEFIEILRNK